MKVRGTMLTKDIKNSKVELIFAYFECLDDEKKEKKYKNFAINFTDKFKVVYNYELCSIAIDKNNKENIDDFWNINGEDVTIMDMTLILGENGVGKTTLLRAIAACATENIESNISNYILIYYLKEKDSFFVKTTCKELVSINDINKEPPKCEFKNIIYNGQRKNNSVFGFYGLARVDENGKIVPIGGTECVETLPEIRQSWNEMLPMNCFYLPTISDNNSTRFIERKKLLHSINGVNNLEILNFLLIDYKNEKWHFLNEYPKFFIKSTSVKQTRNGEIYMKYSWEFFKLINMGSERKANSRSGHRKDISNFFVNYTPYYMDDCSFKKIFFSGVLVHFLARLSVEHKNRNNNDNFFEETKTFLESRIKLNDAQMDIEQVYLIICETVSRVLSQYYEEYLENYREVHEAIENLSEEFFKKDNINISLQSAQCDLTIEDISHDNEIFFVEFVEKIYKFEQQMETTQETFAFLNLEFNEMSTGEYSLLRDVFARIAILKRNIKKTQNKKSILLIMDEPDMGLHLRWIQRFIYTLIKTLEKMYVENKFQIILTSHMPFMVTDFPRNCVVCLCDAAWREEHKEKGLDWVDGYEVDNGGIRGFHPQNGFMCNYYDVLRDAFFVDIPIGEFAQFKYRQLNDEIERVNGEISKQKFEKLQKRINMIDEQLLKKMLQKRLEKCKTKIDQIQELKAQVKRLETEIQKLEKE